MSELIDRDSALRSANLQTDPQGVSPRSVYEGGSEDIRPVSDILPVVLGEVLLRYKKYLEQTKQHGEMGRSDDA